MKLLCVILAVTTFLFVSPNLFAAGEKDSSDILKEGLLGAGAGLAGAAAGKGKGGAWKGALAGAGVNVVGGALLDSISGEHVANVKEVESMPSSQDAYASGYKEGFNNGYKQGYAEGFKDGVQAVSKKAE